MSCEGTVLHGIVSKMMHVLRARQIHLIMHNAERMCIRIYSQLRKSTESYTAIQGVKVMTLICSLHCPVYFVTLHA